MEIRNIDQLFLAHHSILNVLIHQTSYDVKIVMHDKTCISLDLIISFCSRLKNCCNRVFSEKNRTYFIHKNMANTESFLAILFFIKSS